MASAQLPLDPNFSTCSQCGAQIPTPQAGPKRLRPWRDFLLGASSILAHTLLAGVAFSTSLASAFAAKLAEDYYFKVAPSSLVVNGVISGFEKGLMIVGVLLAGAIIIKSGYNTIRHF